MMRLAKGFTLIELLTAMAVGSVLILAAMSLLGASSDGYSRIKQQALAERESRAVMYQLESDLRVLMMSERMVTKSEGDLWAMDSLAFLCLKPESAQQADRYVGDLCAVRYYLKTLMIGGRPVRCLMRGYDQSRDVYGALGELAIDDLLDQRLHEDEPIGFGVLEFSVLPVYRDDSGRVAPWQPDVSASPDWLDLRMVIVKPELRARLDKADDWDGVAWLGDPADVSTNSGMEVVSARIRVGGYDG